MPPAPKKNCSVVVFDFNTKNQEAAKNAVLKIFADKWFKHSKDITRIIFTNVDQTSNGLNVTKDGYENIYVATDIINYDPAHFNRVFSKRNLQTGKADWLEALQVGIECLKSDFIDINGIITKQLLFITDLISPLITSQSNKLKSIIRDLEEYNMYLYIIGPDVTFQKPITKLSDIRTAMKTVEFDGNKENANLVKTIIAGTKNSIICDYKMGFELFSAYVMPIPGQPWQVPLKIGSQLEIPTSTVRLIHDPTGFVLVSNKSDNPAEVIWVDADNEDIEIDFRDTTAGILRHGKFIPMDSDINAMLKCENPRRFNVIGFTNKSNVPEYFFIGDGTYVVIPNEKNLQHKDAVYALIDCLEKQDMYGIAVQVYNANNRPKYQALIPKPNHDPKCFYMVQLPYADDIRFMYEETKFEDGKSEKVDEVYTFLDSIDLHGENCKINLPLTVNLMHDVNDVKVLEKAVEKHLDKHLNFNDINYNLLSYNADLKAEDLLKSVMPQQKVEEESTNVKDKDDSDSDFDFQDDDY